jgi:ketosteroid isomerase-like protein
MSRDTRTGSLVRRATAFWVLPLCIAVLSAGCAKNRSQEVARLRSTIESSNAQFAEAVSRRDVAAIGQLYAADAQAYPPGLAVVSGRAAIQDMWKGLLSMPVGRLQLRTVEVDGNGETAWETGRFTLVGSNGSTMDEGKYIVVWKHEGDAWRLFRDMWSSDSPQQTEPAAPPAAGKPSTP